VKISAEFVKSAASETDFPPKGMPAIALVGRSNVGKSSLINALVRCRVAHERDTWQDAPGEHLSWEPVDSAIVDDTITH
jgi:predicted GTPase